MNRMVQVALALLLAGALPALAHPNHDEEPKATRKAAVPKVRHAVEAVTTGGATRVSVSRDGAKVSTGNAVGVLIVEGKTPRTEYVLQPAGENAMVTREKPNLPPGTRVRVAISLADRTSVQEDVTLR